MPFTLCLKHFGGRPCDRTSNDRKQTDGERPGQVEGPDPTGSAMAAQKKNTKNRKRPPPAHARLPIGSAVIGTMFNMVAIVVALSSVLLCLIVARHFT
jgi:hypothetical protein